ncbi:hypothetical protein BDV40DRAFT_299864 [Aspergillus tamarii]|uniref:Uncharacterized protein n=1 Tax=Aspergillus tamarii TaxID=41984 RepID=A0A5N6UWE5_ASPTM|nr:hypothetical protein BDV40DRAFT_299864 [Aspergillus tamarii]
MSNSIFPGNVPSYRFSSGPVTTAPPDLSKVTTTSQAPTPETSGDNTSRKSSDMRESGSIRLTPMVGHEKSLVNEGAVTEMVRQSLAGYTSQPWLNKETPRTTAVATGAITASISVSDIVPSREPGTSTERPIELLSSARMASPSVSSLAVDTLSRGTPAALPVTSNIFRTSASTTVARPDRDYSCSSQRPIARSIASHNDASYITGTPQLNSR